MVVFNEYSFSYGSKIYISASFNTTCAGSINASGASCPPSDSYTLPVPPSEPSTDNLVIDPLSSIGVTSDVFEPPSSPPRTHHMVTRSRDGSLPLSQFVISRHPAIFFVSTILQEPKSFTMA